MMMQMSIFVTGPIRGNYSLFKKEVIYTVFPKDPDLLPHDFETYQEAKEYGDEEYGPGNYVIESPNE